MPLPPWDSLTEDQQLALEEITDGPRGMMGGPFPALLRSPELLRRAQRVGELLRFGDTSLDPATLEFTILVIARRWNQQVEWGIHRGLAAEAGVSDEACDAIGHGRPPVNLPPKLAVAYDTVTELLDTTDLSEPSFRRAVDEFGERGLVELVTAAGYYTTLAMVMNTAHAAPPEDVPALPRGVVRPIPVPMASYRDGSGPAVVLLHPLGVDHRYWDPLLPRLSRFTVWRFDLPGHGASPVPAARYRIEDVSAAAAAQLGRAGIDRAALVGVSLGGLVAQHMAATHPGRFGRVVLADTIARYPAEVSTQFVQRAATARAEGMSAFVDMTVSTWFAEPDQAEEGILRYVRDAVTATDPEGYALACEALASADLRSMAPKITAPVLAMCGTEEPPMFQEAADWFAASLPHARARRIPGAAHAPALEATDGFAEAVEGFLAER
jgi:pimeloyl-ACP methyl ester carboxylesterase